MKRMAISFKRSHSRTATPSAPDPAASHRRPTPLPETPGHSQASLGQSLVGSLLPSAGPCAQGSVCSFRESVSPVLCQFWQLYGGVNGDLLQEGLCHTQVCCTHSPVPAAGLCWPRRLKHSSVSVSWALWVLVHTRFVSALWWAWCLILNVTLPFLPSCWGFAALGNGVSPHSWPMLSHHSSATKYLNELF